MPNVSIVKDIGLSSALLVVDAKSRFDYPVEEDGASAHVGANNDEVVIHLTGTPDEAAANAILAAIELPTCTASVLTVTVNLGTYLVNDTTVVTDVTDKCVLVCIAIDDTTGVIEVLVFEKEGALSEYGDTPAGKTLIAKLKEYDILASALSEINDFIL